MNSALEIDYPKNFRLREVLIINALGVVPAALIGACGPGGLMISAAAFVTSEYILLASGLPLCIIGGVLLFLWPSVLGNAYVRRIVKRCPIQESPGNMPFVCSVTLSPRLHLGFRGFMEDADDVGHLLLTADAVIFNGDQVRIVLPYTSIDGISYATSGWRGLWIAGKKIKITTNAFPGLNSLTFMERQSNTVTSALRISKEIIRELEPKMQ